MADYVLKGTQALVAYRNTLGVNVTIEQLAAATKIPVIHFSGGTRQTSGVRARGGTFERRLSEAQAQNLASLLGTTVANLKTNAGLEEQ